MNKLLLEGIIHRLQRRGWTMDSDIMKALHDLLNSANDVEVAEFIYAVGLTK